MSRNMLRSLKVCFEGIAIPRNHANNRLRSFGLTLAQKNETVACLAFRYMGGFGVFARSKKHISKSVILGVAKSVC